jgi:predicted AAA+ superfamily ATPase
MKIRKYWLERLEELWRKRPIVWLSGVRRSGKTTLAQMLPEVEYFDCELPKIRRLLSDPEEFLSAYKGKRIILDEIHQIDNPAQLLKIAHDHFPGTRVLATGSSTLAASDKFRDTLTGRKYELRLTPMNWADMVDFGNTTIVHRLLRGGLPPFFLAEDAPTHDYEEWLDAFWSRDIQELFRLEKRQSFKKFFELLMLNSGGIFEANRFAAICEISRTTISTYLSVLEACHVAYILKPYSSRKSTEIISAPKVYMFDTGFVAHYRDWSEARLEYLGDLWKHFVLNELQSLRPAETVNYWRDKRGHEIDFVLTKGGNVVFAIECKWSYEGFDPKNLIAFRGHYQGGKNFVVCQNIDREMHRSIKGVEVTFVPIANLPNLLKAAVS